MSTQADYSDEEWKLLRGTSWSAGFAIVVADRRNSSAETWEEFQTMMRTFDEGPQLYPHNELIAALIVPDYSLQPGPGEFKWPDAHETRAQALADCRQVAAILAAKTTPQEAEEYKRWALRMALQTAQAVTERGWLGRNPAPVSERERLLLQDLAAALGLPDADIALNASAS